MMGKVLVTGGSGLLGSKIIEIFSKFEIIATYNANSLDIDNVVAKSLDIRNEKEVFSLIKNFEPSFIIHTAALTNVDECEKYPDKAWEINVKGTENIAKSASQIGAKVVYISTDYVFDGTKGLYTENDSPNPINYYGKTKLEGELKIKEFCENYAICRLSSLYGWNTTTKKLNFATWIVEKLRKNEIAKLFTDQYTTPTFADNAARACMEIIERDKSGVYHIASKECMSRYEFGIKSAEIFRLNKSLIESINSENLNLPAKRPKRCCLDTNKAERELQTKLLTVKEALMEMKEQEKEMIK